MMSMFLDLKINLSYKYSEIQSVHISLISIPVHLVNAHDVRTIKTSHNYSALNFIMTIRGATQKFLKFECCEGIGFSTD
jgi:hypothetical protein